MPDEQQVRIAKAKGRPMLSWVGKRPLREVRSFPAQLVERIRPPSGAGSASSDVDWSTWPDRYERGGLLFHGDNKEVLAHLLANGFRGKVDLVYIDPPFDSGADYVRKVQLRGASGAVRMDGESHTLGEQIQYTDIWANDNYLQFMYERLLLIRELLSARGSVYLHCDPSRNSYLRVVMDEVFGADAFINEVVWQRLSAHSDSGHYGIIHDTLYYYSRSATRRWNAIPTPLNPRYVEQFFDQIEEGTGRRYARGDLTAAGLRTGETGRPWRGVSPGSRGRHWGWTHAQLDAWDAAGRIHWPGRGMPRLKRYLDEVANEANPQDVWYDIRPIHNQSDELLDFPTQKPEALIDRILKVSSDPGDVVLDCFIGSGTTAAVAQKLGRRWIGADINKGAIQTTEKRLAGIIEEQAASGAAEQLSLESGETPRPAQLGFGVYRVNDYDLAIQHNEAVNLAVEHLGADRTKADSFFAGTLGKELLYLVPFNHPCTLLDLQAVAQELEARPGEARDVVVVALGREIACEGWLADHNRHRPVGKIRLIELRTDPKYGKFFEHHPASARVRFEPDGSHVRVTIDDFLSPSIVERLAAQEGVLTPQIIDWRAMVDSVFIDAAYDGKVFNVATADIPERRQDLVEGSYTVDRPDGSAAPIAVRITDMLGEEVLVIESR
ncbi:MAG TPA: site-specific DNA-methyltransferase [Candidatus Limnocylindrales bacterium]|nr:site-specific DNA-methyltransferase [Candidatus Limnocylindrales bacterium]